MFAEALNVLSVITATALACNFHGTITQWILPWWAGDPAVLSFALFLTLLFGAIVGLHAVIRKLTDLIQLERLHWAVQSLGMFLGAARGLWWSGLLLQLLLSLGVQGLADSVQEHSLLGSRILPVAKQSVEWVVDRFPGHTDRITLIPSIKIQLPHLPSELSP